MKASRVALVLAAVLGISIQGAGACLAAGGAGTNDAARQGAGGRGEATAGRLAHDKWMDPSALELGSRDWLKATEAQAASARRERGGERIDNCPHPFDVLHYDITLTIDVSNQIITGDTRVRSRSEIPGLNHIDLNLTTLTVDAVTMLGSPLSYTYQDSLLAIDLPHPFAAGDSFEVEVTYHGHPANEGPGGFGGFYFNTNPPVAYQMAIGISTQPPAMGKCWFPCYDWPCDKATADYHITVPEGFIAVCNGAFTGVASPAGSRSVTYNWHEGFQVPTSEMSVTASQYTELVDDTYPWIHYWVYPSQVNNAHIHFSNVHTMMDGFIARFGPYPFPNEKFGYAAAPKGDMEHETCVTHQAALIQGNHTFDWILAHEMCHQWWGDCVTETDWRDVWLSEGFATYGEALFQEYAYGYSAYQNYMITQLMNPVLNSHENFPIYDPDYMWGTTVYEKGGTVLHMLRHVMGDARFFGALSAFRAAHEYGNAVTTELQQAAEASYGADLSWFFQEWVYNVGWPEYQYAWHDRVVSGVHHVDLYLAQVQTNGPTFTMPVDVRISSLSGDTTLVIPDDQREKWFDLTAKGLPSSVTLDPDSWILCRKQLIQYAGVPAPPGGAAGPAEASPWSAAAAPNPFDGRTTIRFGAPAGDVGRVELKAEIFSPAGERVRVLAVPAAAGGSGAGEVVWDGRDQAGRPVPSGAYICRVTGAGAPRIARLTVLR